MAAWFPLTLTYWCWMWPFPVGCVGLICGWWYWLVVPTPPLGKAFVDQMGHIPIWSIQMSKSYPYTSHQEFGGGGQRGSNYVQTLKGGWIFFMPHGHTFIINVIKIAVCRKNNWIWVYIKHELEGGWIIFTCLRGWRVGFFSRMQGCNFISSHWSNFPDSLSSVLNGCSLNILKNFEHLWHFPLD